MGERNGNGNGNTDVIICSCGNNNKSKIKRYIDDSITIGAFCTKCGSEFLNQEFVFTDETEKLQLGDIYLAKANLPTYLNENVFMVSSARAEIENLHQFEKLVKPGDHIAWRRPYLIWHHALVTETDVQNGKLRVIHWTTVGKCSCQIVEEWISISKQCGQLYRMNYQDEILNANPPRLVIARGRSRLGSNVYRFFKDNCESLAVFCKKGVAECHQIFWCWSEIRRKILSVISAIPCVILTEVVLLLIPFLFRRAVLQLAKISFAEGIEEGVEEIVREEKCKAIKKKCKNLSKAFEWIAFGVVILIEIITAFWDIYKMHKVKRNGRMTGREFRAQVIERIFIGLVGGLAGAFGTMCPGIVRGICYGLLGGLVGTILASFICCIGCLCKRRACNFMSSGGYADSGGSIENLDKAADTDPEQANNV